MGTRAATRAAMSGFGSRWWSRLTPYTRMGLRAGRTVALGAGRWSKVSPRHPHDSAPARLPCLLRAPAHLAPSHCLGCSSWSPPNAAHFTAVGHSGAGIFGAGYSSGVQVSLADQGL